jgi:sugar lactone lactonase YvrE
MTNRTKILIAVLGLVAVLAGLPGAASATIPMPAATAGPNAAGPAAPLPDTIALPDGFLPEGITIGRLPFAWFGSRADGSIFRANLLTGRGQVFSRGPGTPSVGLKVDSQLRLFVAGGVAGDGRVVSGIDGEIIASYKFTTGTSFVNDVLLFRRAAWFTDSRNAVLYKLPLGRHGGLPAPDGVVNVPLTGDFVQGEGTSANGIAPTPDGKALIIVQSNTGFLFRVDPRTGVARRIDLGTELMTNGDGLLLRGRTLYVVQNRLNTLAVLKLNRAGTAGRVVQRVTDPRFDIPTTVAQFRNRLYLVNGRFTTPPTPTTPYTAVAIPRP